MILLAINSTSTVARAIMATMMIRLTLEMMFCCLMMASWASDRASGDMTALSTVNSGLEDLDTLFSNLQKIFPLEDRSTLDAFDTAIKVWKEGCRYRRPSGSSS